MGEITLTGKQSDFLKIVVAAAGRGDLEAVQALVEADPRWVHTVGSHGRTMLWEASYRGKQAVAEFLVECGADVNASACHYSQHYVEISCYCIARVKGRHALADYLLERGATVNVFTAAYLGETAAVAGFIEADPMLLESTQAQHDSQRSEGRRLVFDHMPNMWATPLAYALSGGSEIRLLCCWRAARKYARTTHGCSALRWAATDWTWFRCYWSTGPMPTNSHWQTLPRTAN